ncbi:hypothetical protein GOP47_0017076, partial [Adiantum capillus-veneris]
KKTKLSLCETGLTSSSNSHPLARMLQGAPASSSSTSAGQHASGGASPDAVLHQQQRAKEGAPPGQQANNQLNHTTVNIPAPAFNRKAFEDKIHSAKRGALLVAGLQLLSRFAGFFALTWATVVLLGGFASVLRLLDFYLITILLLLEGIRLFIVQLFSKPLIHDSGQPSQAMALDVPHIAALVFLLATTSLVLTIVRLILSRSHHLSEKIPSTVQSNLPTSLYVFYSLVVINATLAMASALRRPLNRELCDRNQISWGQLLQIHRSSAQELAMDHINQNSLKCYHDEVYMTAMEVGLREANQLNFLDFAFKKLGWDYKRSIRPETVMELNRDMISYLYHNKQGIAMAFEHLKSGDVWQQQVAASLPGFWAKEGSWVQSQMALLWALRERIYGGGKDADAALNSIECLGEKLTAKMTREDRSGEIPPQHPFLMNDPTAGTNVVDTLVQLLLETMRPNLLFQVRAFEACCRHPHVLCHLFSADVQQLQEAGEDHAEATICGALQDVIVGTNSGAGAGSLVGLGSKLQMLCCKLHSVVAPRPAQAARRGAVPTVQWPAPTTKIYAASSLMTLLCYGREDFMRQQTRDFVAAVVKEGIDPAGWIGPYGRRRNLIRMKDLMVMENLRWRLGLDAYRGWSEVRLLLPNGRELCGEQVLIDHLVMQARQM